MQYVEIISLRILQLLKQVLQSEKEPVIVIRFNTSFGDVFLKFGEGISVGGLVSFQKA